MNKYDILKKYGKEKLIVETRKNSDGFGGYTQEFNYLLHGDQIAFVTMCNEELEDVFKHDCCLTLEELYNLSIAYGHYSSVSIDIWWDDIK